MDTSFRLFEIMNNTAVKIGIQISVVVVPVVNSLYYIPRSRIARCITVRVELLDSTLAFRRNCYNMRL